MKAKKILSLILALTLVVSCVCTVSFVSVNAEGEDYNEYKKMQEFVKPENNYGLAKTVNDGKIIQAWNWSFENITKNLELLAEQGFTTIQVSPPNEIKMPTKGVKVCEPAVNGIAPNGWWMFYQPAGFQLNESEDNALGTKAEFKKMCDEAHKLGLKIIVDAVINHMGTDDDHVGVYDNTSTDPMTHVNPRAQEFEPELIAAKAFHSPWVNMTYKENYWDGWSDKDIEEDLTQHCTSGLPDLDTSLQLVQDTIYDYFVELVECGADGFRFDAAKHIETKHDTYFASDFWEDTLLKLRENYPDKECYAYGEILNKCGDGRPFSEYTELMDVTDSSSYWQIKDAVLTGGGNPIPYYPNDNFTKENVIQWNESHDTYIDGGTSSLTVLQRNKIWALTAARQTITGVYFARPDDATGANRAAIEAICADIVLGDANITSWANPEVRAVNQFDNYFGEAEEYNSNQGGVTMIERGGVGATLVILTGTAKNVNIKAYTLANGTYTDAITGTKFTVSGGKVTGQIGSTGIACIYYSEDTKPTEPEKPVISDPYEIEVTEAPFPVIDGYNTVVYSAKPDWTEAYVYAWTDATGVNNGDWPGTPMKKVTDNNGYGEKQYIAYIPVEFDMYIINNGKLSTDIGAAQTEDLLVTTNMGMYMKDKTGANGTWTIGTWDPEFYEVDLGGNDNPPTIVTDPVTDSVTTEPTEAPTTTDATEPVSTPDETEPVTTAPAETDPTEPSTAPVSTPDETEPTTTAPVTTSAATTGTTEPTTTKPNVTESTPPAVIDGYYLGDADSNEIINVKDATLIQKVLARFTGLTYDADASLVNNNTYLDIGDATTIQKFVAKLLPEDTKVGTFIPR